MILLSARGYARGAYAPKACAQAIRAAHTIPYSLNRSRPERPTDLETAAAEPQVGRSVWSVRRAEPRTHTQADGLCGPMTSKGNRAPKMQHTGHTSNI